MQDERDLSRFTDRILEYMDEEAQRELYCAVQIVPYGEAMIHPYYWRELARLSRHPRIEYVGAQSNMSFSADQMLTEYGRHGGDRRKLRLWGTFHPQMVSLENFTRQCVRLWEEGVSLCAGIVGAPEQKDEILLLRRKLPEQIYVWVNRMDGLGRSYTEEERAVFLEADEYFKLECRHITADFMQCADNNFVEADGTIHPCNLSRWSKGNFYGETAASPDSLQRGAESFGRWDIGDGRTCGRKSCSCYLAYCNRRLPELLFFGPYPAFRIPVYPRAVFLDIDGTLTDESGKIPSERIAQCRALARHSDLYLATSLPLPDARRKTSGFWDLISGGVFANGAVLRASCDEKKWEQIYALPEEDFSEICQEIRKRGGSVHPYHLGNTCYKITICARNGTEVQKLLKHISWPGTCRIIREGECMQITAQGTGKLAGVRRICEEMGYGRDEVFAAGNSENDIPMLDFFPFSAKVLPEGWEVKYP